MRSGTRIGRGGALGLAVLLGLAGTGTLAAEGRSLPSEKDFVDGPYVTQAQVIATTDVRKLGCPDCDPVSRILATGDFNKDGIAEFVLTFESFNLTYQPINVPTQMVIVSADGKPFSGLAVPPSRVHPREGVVADFNGDGVDDLFVAAHGPDGQPFIGEQNVLLLSGPGGTLTDASLTNLPLYEDMAHGATSGDIDGDGDIDLFVVTGASGGRAKLQPYFLINDGKGKFAYSAGADHLPKALSRGRNFFLTGRLADVNGDKMIDLLLAGSADEGQNSVLLFGDNSGRFTDSKIKLPRTPFGVKAYTTDIDLMDLDADGDQDLVLLNCAIIGKKKFQGLYIQILIQDGGKFIDQSSTRIWGQTWPNQDQFALPHNLSLADLNGDGALDIVVQSLNPTWRDEPGDVATQIGLNDGKGNFSPVTPSWPEPNNGYRAIQLLPAFSGGKWILVGHSLFGEFNGDNFRGFGQNLTIYK